MASLTPEHDSRHASDCFHPEVTAAYKYVDSVLATADAQSPVGGFAWHGWALREAFLAGCTHARTLLDQPEAESPATQLAAHPLLEKVVRMGDQAAAWLEANPPGQPVAIEPRGCPTPGACSCVEPVGQPEPEGLTDEELLRTYGVAKRDYCYEGDLDDWPKKEERAATVAGLRAVIAADRARRPAAQPPAEGEVAVSLIELRSTVMGLGQMGMFVAAQRLGRAADLLERLASDNAGLEAAAESAYLDNLSLLDSQND